MSARGWRLLGLAFVCLSLVVGLSTAVGPAGAATLGGALPGPLPLFPADNWWNADVSLAPLDPGSAGFITFIGASRGLHWDGAGWTAGSGAFFDMKTNNRRPEGWTSADAAGLAILPGLLRYDPASRRTSRRSSAP